MEKIYTENELLLQALKAIADERDGLDTSELIDFLTKELKPSGKDASIISGRNDTYFSQKVRNLVSHKRLNKYVDIVEKKFIINENGIDFISENTEDEYSANIETVDDFRDENYGYRIPDKNIELDNMYLSVSDLKRKYDRLKSGITANTLKIDESFQRYGEIWSRKNKSLFIESIILNIPIPSIYLSEDSEGTFLVIDGRQRLSTLFDFMDDKFRLSGLIIMKELNGKKFSSFVGDLLRYKSKIEDRSLHIAKMRYGTDITFIIETFERVNTKGARLNAQEIRNAIYQGESTKLLNRLSDHYTGDNKIIDKKRMKDKYLILRFFAMLKYYKNIESSKKTEFKSITDFLASTMKEINTFNSPKLQECENIFIESYDRVIRVLGKENAFRINCNAPINMVIFEISLIISYLCKERNDEQMTKILGDIMNLGKSKEGVETLFEKNIKYHRDSKENIEERLRWIFEMISEK